MSKHYINDDDVNKLRKKLVNITSEISRISSSLDELKCKSRILLYEFAEVTKERNNE